MSRGSTHNEPAKRGGAGLDAEIFARLQLDGEIFFLTSSFIELSSGFSNRLGTKTNLHTV